MRSCSRLYGVLFTLWSLQYMAHAFTFTTGAATQCENLQLDWDGGTPPFQLDIIPVFGVPRNMTVPPTAFNNGKGSFSVQLPLPQGQRFLITMSDAAGFGTGGTTDVLTVGPSKGAACDTKGPGIAFPFQLNTALQQCRPFIVDGYAQAVQPVSFYGIIPYGQSFVVRPPLGQGSFDWVANVASGTSVLFFMVDALGRQGGSSDILKVGITDDSSCLNSNSPSSTAGSPGATPSGHSPHSSSRTSGTSVPSNSTNSGGGISIGAVAGTVIGAILFLAMVITMSLFFIKKRDRNNLRSYTHPTTPSQRGFQPQIDYGSTPGMAPSSHPYGYPSSQMAAASAASTYPLRNESQVDVNPFESSNTMSYQSPLSTYQPYAAPNVNLYPPSEPQTELFNPYGPSTATVASSTVQSAQAPADNSETSAHQTKAAMAGTSAYRTPSRFILHTDVEDELPANEHGVVELPPQYSARRPHLAVQTSSLLAYDRQSTASDPLNP
ncbi:hypothetical protein AX17_000666 [Amanita inopinata Kibby_2008]|nr:hypothetical protein AX17_000666 [Amanita inopinata Kibby_2008]